MRKEYTVTDEDVDGPVINDENWSAFVKPGMNISLNMVLKVGASWDVRKCPRCTSIILRLNGAGVASQTKRQWYIEHSSFLYIC